MSRTESIHKLQVTVPPLLRPSGPRPLTVTEPLPCTGPAESGRDFGRAPGPAARHSHCIIQVECQQHPAVGLAALRLSMLRVAKITELNSPSRRVRLRVRVPGPGPGPGLGPLRGCPAGFTVPCLHSLGRKQPGQQWLQRFPRQAAPQLRLLWFTSGAAAAQVSGPGPGLPGPPGQCQPEPDAV